MNRLIDYLYRISEKQFKRRGVSNYTGLDYLREKLFYGTMQIILFIGFLAYLPGVILSIKEELWFIAVIDTVAYGSLFYMYFDVKLSTKIKIKILLFLIYFLGVSLLVVLGSFGAGLIWLIGFSILASVFLGTKSALLTILINFITIVLLGIGIQLKVFHTPFFEGYTLATWTAVAINLIVVNTISTVSFVYLIRGLEESLNNERTLKQRLKKKSERLINAKMKAEESDQLKSSFLANVSHEFRTPMNSILGFTEIMLYTNPDEEKRKRYLENIQHSGEQLLQIIHNTIEYSKIEMGKIDLESVKVQVSEIFETVYEQLKSINPEGVKFEYSNLEEEENKFIITDREKLTQIFSNLITNAFKFTSSGKVSYGQEESAHEDFYKFFVKDTGIGIRKEKQKDIFTRFHKEDDFKEGTGLGLSISATLIAHMGGRIWLESEPNVGTNFHFILPKKLVVRDL